MEPDMEATVNALAADAQLPSQPAPPAATVPLRDEQVQNAVAFLSHPKVRGSSIASKRAFLEGKGLTAAEIDEGLKIVPSIPAVPDTAPAYTGLGAQPSAPAKPFPVATADALQAVTPTQYQALQPHSSQTEPIRWTQVVAGAGAIAAGIWVVNHYVIPPAVRWWRGGSDHSAGDKAAAAVAGAIQAQTVEMRSTLEGLNNMVAELKEQRNANGGAVGISDLRAELRTLATSLDSGPRRNEPTSEVREMHRDMVELKALVTATISSRHQPSVGPAIVDPPSFARAEPPAANGHSHMNGHVHDIEKPGRASSPAPSASPSHPASYMEVLEMLERGETPPGIRSDIVDTPPDPLQSASEARLKPRAKPWERSQQGPQSRPASSAASSIDGDTRTVKITELEPSQPSKATSATDQSAEPWKPPSVPQRSIFGQGSAGSSSPDLAGRPS